MSSNMLKLNTLLTLLLIMGVACSPGKKEPKKKQGSGQGIIENVQGFNGWDTVTLRNAFTRLDIVPELGGKVIGYEATGFQMLWHNTLAEGQIDIFQKNDKGQEFINSGGVKVWPAPQDRWQGPPDKILDGSQYSQLIDGDTITLTSPKDDAAGRTGIQFINKYTLVPSSTVVNLNISMNNVVNRNIEWAIQNIFSSPASGSLTIYVPAGKNKWDLISGDKDTLQWVGVKDGLFRAKYNKKAGKAGFKVDEGWVAFHDEDNGIVCALTFPFEKNKKYPGKGYNFELTASGPIADSTGATNPSMDHFDLAIISPLTKILPGESTSLQTKWSVCRCSGVKKVLPVGVIVEDIKMDKDKTFRGTFGVFYAGVLEEFFVDKAGNIKGRTPVMDVSPLDEVSIERKPIIPKDAYTLRYQVVGYDHNLIGIVAEIKL